ncbi:hypothetical protein SBV1_180051 [Verrucomicrobia bacterium]|nr:hypothetical protein SBV1_180051 [Verrucomicrobiota bacterium]
MTVQRTIFWLAVALCHAVAFAPLRYRVDTLTERCYALADVRSAKSGCRARPSSGR